MARLTWDETGTRRFETGVDRGVVYPYNSTTGQYDSGYSWSGLTSVSESPSGADANDLYADNIKYLTLRAAEEFGATIEAYNYPEQFAILDGTAELVSGVSIGQQSRGTFGFSFRSRIGNDTDGDAHGYMIHLIYGASVSPSERAYASVNDSPEAISFSWELSTIPVTVTGFKPTAIVRIDSTKFTTEKAKKKLEDFEDILYGTNGAEGATGTEPRLPLPNEVKTLLTVAAG